MAGSLLHLEPLAPGMWFDFSQDADSQEPRHWAFGRRLSLRLGSSPIQKRDHQHPLPVAFCCKKSVKWREHAPPG